MEKVVTVNLGGNPFTFDESAYASLRAYLDRAEAALAANPDKAEILRDLEQAIADKCASYLSAHKTVVSAAEIATILAEMGPVDGGADGGPEGAEQATAAASSGPAKKRLYRIPDNAVLGGVCAGLAAYFAIDPILVRIGFVVLAFLTHGLMILAYIIMLFVVPAARTSEDFAAAHGLPFNAQEVIDRAQRQAQRFAESGPWASGRRWRRHARRYWRNYASYYGPPGAAPAPPAQPSYATRMLAGFSVVLTTIIGLALSVAFLVAIVTLATTGAVLGFAPPASVPVWLAIVLLVIVFAIVSAPIRALRHASYAALGHPYRCHPGGGLFPALLLILVGWLAYTHIPSAHAWMDDLFAQIRLWSLSLSL
ncbi:MAG: PspC domain-containing protein [Hyphomonadaceae bacterium]|nr:PspC domain-containing protein [Hyphomonadaceae bacterium]